MSSLGSIPSNVSKLLQVATEKSQTENQIAYAVAGKQAQASKQAGQAALALLDQAVNVQSQIASGKLDVRA
jgi:hypothetical protein